jgi:hypothetical protein
MMNISKSCLGETIYCILQKAKFLEKEKPIWKEGQKSFNLISDCMTLKYKYFETLRQKNLAMISNFLSKRVLVQLLHLIIYSRYFVKLITEINKNNLKCVMVSILPDSSQSFHNIIYNL